MSMHAKVALVDDEENVRKALERLLRSANFVTVGYASAADFLKGLADDQPDCLLLDIQMPGMTGLELQEELRRAGRSIPLIFVTGIDNPDCRAQAMRAGAAAYLLKPGSEEILLEAIRSALKDRPPEGGHPTAPKILPFESPRPNATTPPPETFPASPAFQPGEAIRQTS
jgi:FixJ family two-component response regulator